MDNNTQVSLEIRVLAVLDYVLLKMGDALEGTFDPFEPESSKLLREYRSTMSSRRTWAKEYNLINGNENNHPLPIVPGAPPKTPPPPHSNKVAAAIQKTAVHKPSTGNSVAAEKTEAVNRSLSNAEFDAVFKDFKFKNPAQPQIDQNSGLLCHR